LFLENIPYLLLYSVILLFLIENAYLQDMGDGKSLGINRLSFEFYRELRFVVGDDLLMVVFNNFILF